MPPVPSQLVRIEAPGLVLREFGPDDVDDLLAAFADPEVALWNPGPAGDDAATDFMGSRNDWSAGDHASWAVADPTGRLVGSVSLHRIDQEQLDAEVGYWVAPWGRRRGYAATALGAATRFGVHELGLHRIYLYHAVDNAGSCGVATAAAFVHEGTLRESYRYADGVFHDEHLHAVLSRDLLPRDGYHTSGTLDRPQRGGRR